MAVAFRQAAGTAYSAAVGGFGPSLGVAPLAGSLLVIVSYATQPANAGSSFPSGLTLLRSDYDGSGAYLSILYKISNGSDGDADIAHNSNPWTGSIIIAEYTGVHATLPIDTSASASITGTSTTVVAPTVTASQAGMLLGLFGQTDGTGAGGGFSPPAGMTERIDVDATAGGLWLELADLVVAAGATGAKTATYSRTPSISSDTGTAVILRSANTPPTAPTLTAPADAAVTTLNSGATFSWTHNDADANPQTEYALKRTKNGVTEWWDGSAWVGSETYVATSTQSVTFPSGKWATGTYTWTVSTGDGEDRSPYAATRTVTSNAVPNAPALGYPSGGQTIDRANTLRLSWTFSDPDTGDSQSKYDLRYRIVGAGSWTTVTATVVNQFRDFTGGTFTADDFEWQVRTYDALGAFGAYSASGFFTAADAPAGPTITDPVNGGTVTSNPYTVTWSAADQDAYQLRTVADSAGSPDTGTVYTDTGTVESAVARSAPVAFGTNGRDEHIQLRVRFGGVWSSWASNAVSVDYTPPAAATLTVLGSDSEGAISVTVDQPAPTGSQPVATGYDLFRREDDGDGIRIVADQPMTAVFIDYTPASGVEYEYAALTYGANGTSTLSAWYAGSPSATPVTYYGGAYS